MAASTFNNSELQVCSTLENFTKKRVHSNGVYGVCNQI